MTLDELKRSVVELDQPPARLGELLKALWWDARGDWDRAHRIAQDVADTDGARVHAYLHRKEGDLGNACYWYRRAGRSEFEGSLEEEWLQIAESLLDR